MIISRRHFLARGARSAVSLAALVGTSNLNRAFASTVDTSGYKALVCVFLYGGNNGFNWVVPTSAAGYATYSASRSNLALPQASLLPLSGTASDGYSYGLHASCPELRDLFQAGHAAVLCNVGTLVQPATAAQARDGSVPLPPQLMSHEDQQTEWMTSIPNSPETYGWAGRIGDLMITQGLAAKLSFNVSLNGDNYWQAGKLAVPYMLGISGAPTLNETDDPQNYRNGLRKQAALDLLSQASNDSNLMISEYAAIQRNAAAKVGLVNNAFASTGDLATVFPNNEFGQQLHQVARCIKAGAQIGDTRQLFFVGLGGFDTHNAEITTQAQLLQVLSQNLGAFWNALVELGMTNDVTVFTASDFGRSLGSNGDGSDHAWGNHHMIVGGAVKGGTYYGRMPSLAINGPDDMGDGRVVPTTATDQYAATLAKWFGVADADLDGLFPNLRNFVTRDLGFLA